MKFLARASLTLAYLAGWLVGFSTAEAAPPKASPKAAVFAGKGELQRPLGYRSWVFVGAPVTPNDMNDGHASFPEFHHVYIDPAGYRYYQQHGEFGEGTVLIKELVSVGGKSSSSGKGYFPGEFLGVEAAVKSKSRFPKEPGNWGYFRFTDVEAAKEGRSVEPATSAKASPTSACSACHQRTAAQDSVFTQHYPILRAAENSKTAPEDP